MENEPKVLMIQTISGVMPFIFPMGLISLMNSLHMSKLGVFIKDLNEFHLMHAKVVIIPIHWFYSIPEAIKLARNIKKINKNIWIITGGYTATMFADQLIQNKEIDVIIRGDADGIFENIVNLITQKQSYTHMPNLTFQGGRTPTTYSVTTDEFARANYRDVEWHPSFKRIALKTQSLSNISYIYPWINVARGCSFDCQNCMAAPKIQHEFFGRSLIARPAWAVYEDLNYFSNRKDINYCYFNTDFINTLGMEHAESILGNSRFNLSCYYEWYRYPTRDGIDLLLNSFNKIYPGIFLNAEGQCVNQDKSSKPTTVNRLVEIIDYYKNNPAVNWILHVDQRYLKTDPIYAKNAAALCRFKNMQINRIDHQVMPVLDCLDAGDIEILYEQLRLRAENELQGIQRRQAIISVLLQHLPSLGAALFKINSSIIKRYIREKNKKSPTF